MEGNDNTTQKVFKISIPLLCFFSLLFSFVRIILFLLRYDYIEDSCSYFRILLLGFLFFFFFVVGIVVALLGAGKRLDSKRNEISGRLNFITRVCMCLFFFFAVFSVTRQRAIRSMFSAYA